MSGVVKHSVSIRGHRTSFSLELAFFDELLSLSAERRVSLAALVAEVDEARPRESSLSSALRLFVLAEAKKGRLDPTRVGASQPG